MDLPVSWRAAVRGLALVPALAAAARANNPPGPQAVVGELGGMVLLVAITALAGGYAIERAKTGAVSRGGLLLGVVGVFVSAMHEGFALLVCAVVILLALARAVQLLLWARRAGAPDAPAHLAGASRARLVTGAALLVALVVPLAGAGVAFAGYWPRDAVHEGLLRKLVSELLREGLARRDAAGLPVYPEADPSEGSLRFPLERAAISFSRGQADYARTPDGHGFTLRLRPLDFPPWPYRLLASQASFYVDQTGQLRAIRVNAPVHCPPDAPVVGTIEPAPETEAR